jgi:predicted site-specific integrase-resolvase
MRWMKARSVCERVPVSLQTIYAAARSGRLKVARIGAGRNWVTCDEWVDEWLRQSADQRPPDEARR